MTYDSNRREIVLFGGLEGPTTAYPRPTDTWVWNGTNWLQRFPANSPTGRSGHRLVYDEARREVVLFAGVGQNDTWVWDGVNWTQRQPLNSPPGRQEYVIAHDRVHEQVVLFGGIDSQALNDTWIWNGSNWNQKLPARSPQERFSAGADYDPVRERVIVAGGAPNFSSTLADTWAWDGANWLAVSGNYQTIDVSAKPGGVWNFTSIFVPGNLTVLFKNGSGNGPVRWLASGDVRIDGIIDASGFSGAAGGLSTRAREGGPGGFAGGLGGLPSFQGSPFAGTPGQGPGGGAPGTNSGQNGLNGTHASTYGSPFIQPLIGGSGGGGSGSAVGSAGNLGGAGGGVIQISSSRDIIVNGTIKANGGAGYNGSGAGAAGAIQLRADRITLSSSARLEATNDGRVRLESIERSLAGTILPTNAFNVVVSLPVADPAGAQSTLRVISVAGANVVQPPGGDLFNPDVTFSQAGDITVTVQGQNIPDGTPVRLRVTMIGNVINKPAAGEPPVLLSGGTATFTLTVPRGRGTIQAFAEFTVP